MTPAAAADHASRPSTEALELLLRVDRYHEAIAIMDAVDAAVASGVWARLARAPDPTVDDLAAACGLTRRGASLLADALVALGLVERDGRTLRARFGADALDGTRRAAALVRRLRGDPQPPQHLDDYADVAPLLAERFADQHRAIADALRPVTGRLVDVGAGASPVGRRLAALDGTEVTALDHPAVLDRLAGIVAAEGVADRFTLVPGDLRSVPWPSDADVVLLSGVLHLFGADDAVALVRRAAASVRAGGRVAIATAAVDEPAPLRQALYALDVHLRQPDAELWPYRRIAAWLAGAGLGDLTRVRVGPFWLITAVAPT